MLLLLLLLLLLTLLLINKTSKPVQNQRVQISGLYSTSGPSCSFARNSPFRFPTREMGSRELLCAVAPKLSPAESKCTLKSFRCALLRVADIRLDQNLICRVRAAAAAALSRLRWSTSGLLACAWCTF